MKKNIDLKLKKVYTKACHIIYSLSRFIHLESNASGFCILRFFWIYYDFSKILQGRFTDFKSTRVM
jgi:hypothetical protein